MGRGEGGGRNGGMAEWRKVLAACDEELADGPPWGGLTTVGLGQDRGSQLEAQLFNAPIREGRNTRAPNPPGRPWLDFIRNFPLPLVKFLRGHFSRLESWSCPWNLGRDFALFGCGVYYYYCYYELDFMASRNLWMQWIW